MLKIAALSLCFADKTSCLLRYIMMYLNKVHHGRRSVGGHAPLLFEVEGTPSVLSPYFLGVDIFYTNAHDIQQFSLNLVS